MSFFLALLTYACVLALCSIIVGVVGVKLHKPQPPRPVFADYAFIGLGLGIIGIEMYHLSSPDRGWAQSFAGVAFIVVGLAGVIWRPPHSNCPLPQED